MPPPLRLAMLGRSFTREAPPNLVSPIRPECFALAEATSGRSDVAFVSGAAVAMVLCVGVIFLENPQRQSE